MRSGATLTLVSDSVSFTSFDAVFEANSSDGSRVVFSSQESIDVNDTDGGRSDIYQWSSGPPAAITLLSIGAASPSDGQFEAIFDGSSKDGTRVFFDTDEKLITTGVGADTDSRDDIYEWSAGGLTEDRTRQSGAGPRFLLTSDDGNTVVFDTVERVLGM